MGGLQPDFEVSSINLRYRSLCDDTVDMALLALLLHMCLPLCMIGLNEGEMVTNIRLFVDLCVEEA